MRVKLNQLQRVVKQAVNEEKATELLREEITRVLGPIMDTEVRLEELAEAVNDRVAVMERTGRESRLNFKPSVLARFTGHKSVEVRVMCARLLPERFATRLANDSDQTVRLVAARRLSLKTVKETMKKFPNDTELRRTYNKRRRIEEAHDDEHLHIHDEERLGDSVKQQDTQGLSDVWYRTQADLFMQDYGQDMYDTTGQSIDYNWEEAAVRNFCRHNKATSGIEIDETKLMKALQEIIKEREECVLKRAAARNLRELASRLDEEHDREMLNEQFVMPCLDEANDPVEDLLSARLTPSSYMERVEEEFNVRFTVLPPSLKKYRIGENVANVQIPMKAMLPSVTVFRSLDERALDLYVEYWNKRQELSGEPVRISWNPDPVMPGCVGFQAMLR